MAKPVIEMEGTWEELAVHATSFRGHRLKLIVLPDSPEANASTASLPLSKKFAEIRREDVSAWERVPQDLAEQHDHYVYGWPKK